MIFSDSTACNISLKTYIIPYNLGSHMAFVHIIKYYDVLLNLLNRGKIGCLHLVVFYNDVSLAENRFRSKGNSLSLFANGIPIRVRGYEHIIQYNAPALHHLIMVCTVLLICLWSETTTKTIPRLYILLF